MIADRTMTPDRTPATPAPPTARATRAIRARAPRAAAALCAAVAACAAPAPAPGPPPAEVLSIDGIVGALYDVVSGPAGAERDADRLRSLFHPEAGRLWAPHASGALGTRSYEPIAPDDYVERTRALFELQGFYEREVHRETDRFGAVAHVFSTYEARRTPTALPFVRGINSIQLLFEGDRWWITSLAWYAEDDEHVLPAAYEGR